MTSCLKGTAPYPADDINLCPELDLPVRSKIFLSKCSAQRMHSASNEV